MIKKKENKEINLINTPENYFSRREHAERVA